MNASKAWVSVCVLIGLSVGTANAVNIETVPVGNPGNAPDTRYATPGYGSVGYIYNIGKYEVTAGQYCEFLNKVAAMDTYGLYNPDMANTQVGSGISRSGSSGSYLYSVDAAFVNRPVNNVSYWDACRFTNWLHNGQPAGGQGPGTTERGTYTLDGYNGYDGQTIQRNAGATWAVTSEDEWYKAAYYDPASSSYYDYPTSSNTAPGQDMADASGNNANYYTAPYAYPIDSPYYTTVVGEFQNSASPYGTFDQGGNVWEWNEAIVYQDPTYSYRGARGGSFDSVDVVIFLHAFGRDYGSPVFEDYYVGFRVVYIPEPATLGLLALGGLAFLRRKTT